jgi:predicted phosphodiesterase
MRTLIVSDLHLGNGGPYDVFEGGAALPALIDHLCSKSKLQVIVNGDAVDFLMNDDPLELDPARAVTQARAIATYPASAAVLLAFGRVLAQGGSVTIRMGNHDVELFLPEVQQVFRGALGQPNDIAAALVFSNGDEPAVLDVGGTRVLVTHGEQNDDWNRIDYAKLRAGGKHYKYAPGSVLVKKILNPGVATHQMRFLSLLKPDFQGAALSALAVDPTVAKNVFQGASMSMLWQLYRRGNTPVAVAGGEAEEPELGLDKRLADAGLDQSELDALEAQLDDNALVSFSGDDGVLKKAKIKLARNALSFYARMQKRLTGSESDNYFQLDPAEDEWTEGRRLAEKYSATAIIFGHSHAARFRHDSGLLCANSGTWIGLMKLPSSQASDDDWAAYLEELYSNKALDPAKQKLAKVMTRFTAVLLAPHDRGGSTISLVEWIDGHLSTLRSGWVPAQRG